MVFVVIGITIIAMWSFMFTSRLYRWAFATWPFFAALTVMSFVYLVITIVLAIVCRANFGRGLAPYREYCHSQETQGELTVSEPHTVRSQVSYDDVDFVPVTPKNVEAGFDGEYDNEKMDFLDVPITITAPDGESRPVSKQSNSPPGKARRISRIVQSRSSWTTLLDNYSFTFATSRSQQSTQLSRGRAEDQLPTSYVPRQSVLSPVVESVDTKRPPPSKWHLPPEKNAYNGFALTWDEVMVYKSDADRSSRIMPSRPPTAMSIGRGRSERASARSSSIIGIRNDVQATVPQMPALRGDGSSENMQERPVRTKSARRSVKIMQREPPVPKTTSGLPQSPRVLLSWF